MKHSNKKRVGAPISQTPPEPATRPANGQPDPMSQQAKQSRNKANTIRNAAKAEHYLMEVEKAHGFAKSWALRERLEQGQVSLDELMRR